MIKSTFELEKKLLSEGYEWVIGIDEAGRGPLAGPVVAVATTARNAKFPISNYKSNSNDQISNDKKFDLIRDSKTLSEKQRESLFDFIHEHFYVGVGICDQETIDRMNILEATYLAMKKAITSLMRGIPNSQFPISNEISNPNIENKIAKFQDTKCIILIDGNRPIPNFSGVQKAIINGDKHVKSISAASIIAKVTRDRIMQEMHQKYPQYGFDRHKGYGTRYHMEMIEKEGPCDIHRTSFYPISKFAKKPF